MRVLDGDIFTVDAQVLVNPVNTHAVMGAGIARGVKERFPDVFVDYCQACRNGLDVGALHWSRPHDGTYRYIVSFPTKRHWRNPSTVSYVERGLERFAATYADYDFQSAVFPALGCGYGGLDFERDVQPVMERHLGHLPLDITVCALGYRPHPAPSRQPAP